MNPPPHPLQAAVLGDSDASPAACQLAEQIGAMLAEMKITLITGGGGGAMDAACRGAAARGGLTVGILPSAQRSDANPHCHVVIPTGLGHARNAVVVLAADFVVALGESAGTLSELCLAWIHALPIFVMSGFCGRWETAIRGGVDHRGTSRVIECESLAALGEGIRKLIG